jgi:DNA repair exonuclease SbcCD ATPase subunit
MFTLKSLRVRGFRGFLDTDAGNFDLRRPITILFGQNGRAKSSTLNAIEWGLFGTECSGQKTKIRERIDWPIANRHANRGEVVVELEMGSPDEVYLVRRELRPRPGRKTPEESLEVELPDSECLTGSKAELFLDRLHRSTFRDFATTVYQHQEAIRAIITVEPRDRNDAIDRLLGLADYRNLLSALQAVKAKSWQKDFLDKWVGFERNVETALNTHENIVEERRNEATTQAGVPKNKLNAKTALTIAGGIQQALDQFATEAGLEVAPLQVPQEWTGLKTFCVAVQTAINNLRGQMPAVKEQGELVERRGKLIGLKSDLETAKGKQAEIGKGIRELDKEHGGQNSVIEQLAKLTEDIKHERARLRETNARAALITEAINFLTTEEEKDRLSDLCPVCGHKAPGLLETLHQQWEGKLQAQTEKSEKTIKSLQTAETCLQIAADKYKNWNDKQKGVVEELERCFQQIKNLFTRNITAEDDPLALLNGEADKIKGRLERLEEAIKEKQRKLDQIELERGKVRIIDDILHLEEKKRIIEQIQQSAEYKELEELRDRAAELVDDLEAIREAIGAVANEEARDKLAAAQTSIDRYFRELTHHPAISAIKLKVDTATRTQGNDYAIKDQDGNDLTPILSQGDLNALALAFFLGLAASAKDSGTFGFILMDDPSQSLDSEHKKRLVQVLNEVADQKQLMISTMDRELRDYLVEGLTKMKTEYVFEAWTPEQGPTIIHK